MELRRAEGRLQGHRRHRPRPHRPVGRRAAPHVHFEIQPAGRGAPRIDPKPILDGWKLLETTAIYRAAGKDPFGGSEATIGQILLMSKEVLAQRVLADPRIETYSCGRTDIESGQIDRRTLATLEYLVERGYRLTITSLKCGHSFYTTSGNVSAHSSGNAVDIAAGQRHPDPRQPGPRLDHRGRRPRPAAAAGHDAPGADHHPDGLRAARRSRWATTTTTSTSATRRATGPRGSPTDQLARMLKPDQWERLIDRLGEIDNPEVPSKPSDAALPAGKGDVPTPAEIERGSDAHRGE